MVNYFRKILKLIDKEESIKIREVVVGFDGFVDKLVHPISEKSNEGSMEFFHTIEEFGSFVQTKANKSCSIELDTVVQKAGGNTPIFGNTISKLGINTKCIGAFGYPKMNEVFLEHTPNLKMISIGEPGYCTALEFNDGKIMFSDNDGINQLDYELIKERFGEKKLLDILEKSDMMVFMNWSELLGMTSIWEGMLENIFPKIKNKENKKIFVDISDCSSRGEKDIFSLTNLLTLFSRHCDVVLSLNLNEVEYMATILKLKGSTEEIGMQIMKNCDIHQLVVHVVDGAYAICRKKQIFLPNRYVEKPIISTGGGDNFNAGLAFGLLQGFELDESVVIGNAISSYYVTYGESPNLNELKEFINSWAFKI